MDSRVNAVLDLGSNNFHLILARREGDKIYYLERVKERVFLADGLESAGVMSEEAMSRAYHALEHLKVYLKGLEHEAVKVVGTNALRMAQNAGEFLREAREILGFPIEVITGAEEARLIYRGVSQHLPPSGKKRLILDIGGGSTELIVGENMTPHHLESFTMGCVNWSERFFPGGRLSEKGFEDAVTAVYGQLADVVEILNSYNFEQVFGSSDTVKRVENILIQRGLWREGVTRQALEHLRREMLAASHVDELHFAGLDKQAMARFPGGFAILFAVVSLFDIKRLKCSPYALREGLVYELLLGGAPSREKALPWWA